MLDGAASEITRLIGDPEKRGPVALKAWPLAGETAISAADAVTKPSTRKANKIKVFMSEPVANLKGGFGAIADDRHLTAVAAGQIDIDLVAAV